MLISVATDDSELANYGVVKMLNSASKGWNPELLVFFISSASKSKMVGLKNRVNVKAAQLNVKTVFEFIDNSEGETHSAQVMCKKAGEKEVMGFFVPENMPLLSEALKKQCPQIPVEEVSSDLFPSIWDMMTRKVSTVNVNDPLNYAADIMVKKRIGSLVVMDRGRVTGILTEHDFVKAYAEGGSKERKKVRDVMSHPVITLDRSGTIFEACELMRKHMIKKLVILDGNQLQGIITTTDIAKLPLNISESLNYLVSKIKELSI